MANFTRVARLGEVPESGLLAVEVDGRQVVLARVDGEIHALDGVCTHAEALLAEGSLYEECLMCPVHGGEFDARTGEAMTLPVTEPLAIHDVRIDGDEIHVRLRSA